LALEVKQKGGELQGDVAEALAVAMKLPVK
jgi:hypothetical protein